MKMNTGIKWNRISSFIMIMLLTAFLAGCSYYQVTDVGTGKIYCTTGIDHTKSGAVKFKDCRSEAEVVLQASEVKKISKERFEELAKKN
jgi:hypothetical protein